MEVNYSGSEEFTSSVSGTATALLSDPATGAYADLFWDSRFMTFMFRAKPTQTIQ